MILCSTINVSSSVHRWNHLKKRNLCSPVERVCGDDVISTGTYGGDGHELSSLSRRTSDGSNSFGGAQDDEYLIVWGRVYEKSPPSRAAILCSNTATVGLDCFVSPAEFITWWIDLDIEHTCQSSNKCSLTLPRQTIVPHGSNLQTQRMMTRSMRRFIRNM